MNILKLQKYLKYTIGTEERRKNVISEAAAGLIGAGIAAAGSATSAAISAGAATNLNRRNRSWQHNEAILAYKRQKEMYQMQQQAAANEWNREFEMVNGYNSPEAVRKRLEQAGYSPFLYDGNNQSNASVGSGTVSTPANVAQAGTPSTNMPNIPDFGQTLSNGWNMGLALKQTKIQDYLSKAQFQKMVMETIKTKADTLAIQLQNGYNNQPYIDEDGNTITNPTTGNPYTIGEWNAQKGGEENKWNVKNAIMNYIKGNTDNALEEVDLYVKQAGMEDLIETIHQNLLNMKKAYQVSEAQRKLIYGQLGEVKAQTRYLKAQTKFVNATIIPTVEKLKAETEKLKGDTITNEQRQRITEATINGLNQQVDLMVDKGILTEKQADMVYAITEQTRHEDFRNSTTWASMWDQISRIPGLNQAAMIGFSALIK